MAIADKSFMTKVRYSYALVLLMALLASGCDKQVSDYVDGVKRNIPRNTTEGEPMTFKITPGVMATTATNGATEGAITGTITPTNQVFLLDATSGTDMSMSVSISRKRVQMQ